MKRYRRGFAVIFAVLLMGPAMLALAAPAEEKPADVTASDEGQAAEIRTEAYVQTPPSHWHDVDNPFMQAFHHPMEGLEMGLDLRLREVYARNIFTMNDSWGDNDAQKPGNWNNYHWQRYRTRWSTKWTLSPDVDFNTRLVWEFWGHCDPERNRVLGFFANQNYDFDEALFDHFNIQWRNAFDAPLTLTFGRQDIILGTGWLVLDGTPKDGSRTIFFDAVRGQFQVSDTSKLDLIYIQQYDDESKWLVPFNHGAVDERRHLTNNQDENGVIVYYTSKVNDNVNYDAYYMYKREMQSDWAEYWNAAAHEGETNTFGGRLFGDLDENWNYSAEAAFQCGRYSPAGGETVDQRAFGANTRLMYAFRDDLQNEVHVGYEYLSGDDPDTTRNEKFNTLWGDWPQYQRGGDLQSYMWTFEPTGALGEVTNLHRFGIGHSFKPSSVWTVATDYNLYWADETYGGYAYPVGGNTLTNDNFRGQMLSAIATYQCCQKFKTHFLVDYFIPGDYYQVTDDALFARINLEWTF